MFASLLVAGLLAVGINAQSQVYGQCGGIGWTGPTTCVAGSTCVYSNSYYSQCLPGSSNPTTTSKPGGPTTTAGQPPAGSATLHLAGDSTTAVDSGTQYQGWGVQIGKYLSIPVVNHAVAGKSSRSFTDLGYFSQMYSQVKSGDVVIIEFGHNEGGGPAGNPQQGVCPGTDLTTTCNDNGKTVYTYFKYMTDAINQFKAKGAKVIVSSQTPNNPFKDTSGTPIYVGYAQQVASQTSVAYVDHFDYLLTEYKALGASTVNGLFPVDNIHTSSTGADYAAQALIKGVLCASGDPLAPYVKNTNVKPDILLLALAVSAAPTTTTSSLSSTRSASTASASSTGSFGNCGDVCPGPLSGIPLEKQCDTRCPCTKLDKEDVWKCIGTYYYPPPGCPSSFPVIYEGPNNTTYTSCAPVSSSSTSSYASAATSYYNTTLVATHTSSNSTVSAAPATTTSSLSSTRSASTASASSTGSFGKCGDACPGPLSVHRRRGDLVQHDASCHPHVLEQHPPGFSHILLLTNRTAHVV
ncbi:hypothetical protein FRC05_001586 [Tulasnella sp. 425]|nr:hypothetical protein FRC05_001586 [Tulasnella sp. 425]